MLYKVRCPQCQFADTLRSMEAALIVATIHMYNWDTINPRKTSEHICIITESKDPDIMDAVDAPERNERNENESR